MMLDIKYTGIKRELIPWFPVIDPEKCAGCGACINYCNREVLAAGENSTVVANPYNCLVGCAECKAICDWGAITLPSKNELIEWIYKLRK